MYVCMYVLSHSQPGVERQNLLTHDRSFSPGLTRDYESGHYLSRQDISSISNFGIPKTSWVSALFINRHCPLDVLVNRIQD